MKFGSDSKVLVVHSSNSNPTYNVLTLTLKTTGNKLFVWVKPRRITLSTVLRFWPTKGVRRAFQ